MFGSPRLARNDRLANASSARPVARGERGRAVEILQQCLSELGIALPRSTSRSGLTDGIFGPETEAAVRRFQALNGLKADGMAGPRTLAALDAMLVQRDRAERARLHADASPTNPNASWFIG